MDFKRVLLEQRQELEEKEKKERFIEREQAGLAESYLGSPNVLAVLGVRRGGKSVFSYMLARTRPFGYVNFLDERLAGVKTEDLNTVLQNMYELHGDLGWIVLDELQNVPGWELFASRLRNTKRVIITGSSSRLLSGELATSLTGRHLDCVLHPFSFREYLACRGLAKPPGTPTTRELAAIMNRLNAYMDEGGFPEVRSLGKPVLRVIYDDILTKDVLARHNVDNREQLRALARHLVSNCGSETSYASLGRSLGIKHVSTVSNWISYLEEAFLVLKLERFDYKLKRQYLSPKKIYCVDNGLLGVVALSFSDNRGRLLENAVAVELARRKAGRGFEVYYWRDYRQHEVDFVIKRGTRVRELVQVTLASSRGEVGVREVRALLEASEALRCRNLTVITWDYGGVDKAGDRTIRFTPLWRWLLEPSGMTGK